MNCFDKAAQLLSRRSHFRRQLEAKLEARRYPRPEIEQTLDRLVELRLLDDQRCADEFIEFRLRRSPVGHRRMRAELLQRGAPPEIIDQALDRGLPDDDLELARSAAAKRSGGGTVERAALARFLDRQGFSQRAILRVVEESTAAEQSLVEGVSGYEGT